jgi:hypothetical protein
MATAWIGFAGVALGAILGLLPRYWDLREQRQQRELEFERQRVEADARERTHRTGMLMKVARTTNEFLAAWGHQRLGQGDVAERRIDAQNAFDRSAEMMAAWSEALVVIEDDGQRSVVETTIKQARPHVGRAESLDELAAVAERGLGELLGIGSD